MQTTYYQKLKDPRWQRRRLQIFERDEFKCRSCGCGIDESPESVQLHVHHLRYEKNTDPWDYPSGDLLTLCNDCHECAEEIVKMVRKFSGDLMTHDCIRTILEMFDGGYSYEICMGMAQLRRDILAGKIPAPLS